jgi:hypothetical protein
MAGIAGARVRKSVLAGTQDSLAVHVHTGTRDEEMPGGLSASWMVPQISS